MRDLDEDDIERYAERLDATMRDLTPNEKQKVLKKLGGENGKHLKPREEILFDDVNFDIDLDRTEE